MVVYKEGNRNEIGSSTYIYTEKFQLFTDLSKHNFASALDLVKRCYEWLEETQPSPGVLGDDSTKARSQMLAVTLFPGKNGGYAVAQNARGPALETARSDIRKDAPALKEAIGVVGRDQQVHAEVLSWLIGETRIRPPITQAGREKHYPDGTITIVFGRRGDDYVVEDKKVKLDDCGKPVVKAGTKPRQLAACVTSSNRSCQDIGRALGVQIRD
jgi:hypothetical protein